MGGTDAKDILGLPKTPLSLTQEKKSRPQKESHRKPDGISREVGLKRIVNNLWNRLILANFFLFSSFLKEFKVSIFRC